MDPGTAVTSTALINRRPDQRRPNEMLCPEVEALPRSANYTYDPAFLKGGNGYKVQGLKKLESS